MKSRTVLNLFLGESVLIGLLGAIGFGVGISVILALYPEWRTSKLKPVKVLKYEFTSNYDAISPLFQLLNYDSIFVQQNLQIHSEGVRLLCSTFLSFKPSKTTYRDLSGISKWAPPAY